MNRRRAAASSTFRPVIALVISPALRVEPRRYLAVAETRTVRSLLLHCGRSFGVLPVPAVRAGRGELAKPMTDHVLGHVDRDVLLAVVDGDRVPDEVGKDHRCAGPGLDDLLLAPLVHLGNAAEEPRLDERPLLDRSRHALFSSPLRLAVTGSDDEPIRRLVAPGAITHRGLAPGGLRRHADGRLALATA